jgi:hypothetical protein
VTGQTQELSILELSGLFADRYKPACVKCGKDVAPEDLDSVDTDTNIGKMSWYIHKECLAKAKTRRKRK